MKKHEKGQGLVEYALILVLVSIVVIAILVLLGPTVGNCFAGISRDPIRGDLYDVYSLEVSMESSDETADIDVHPLLKPCLPYAQSWSASSAHYGAVENHGNGTFTYRRSDTGLVVNDSFTYSVYIVQPDNAWTAEGRVSINIDEPALASSIKSSSFDTRQMNATYKQHELDSVEIYNEYIKALSEADREQIENIGEGLDLNIEAFEEGIDVLMDNAQYVQNQLLNETLSQAKQAAEDGNWEAVPEILVSLASQLSDTPLDVYVDLNLKMAPRLIKACEVVANGTVSPELMADTLEAAEGLDDDLPIKPAILLSLEAGLDEIETRNSLIQEHTSFQAAALDKMVELLELAGEDELAQQLIADREVCSP